MLLTNSDEIVSRNEALEVIQAALVSVDELEEVTGLDFFPDLDADFEELEKSVASSFWEG